MKQPHDRSRLLASQILSEIGERHESGFRRESPDVWECETRGVSNRSRMLAHMNHDPRKSVFIPAASGAIIRFSHEDTGYACTRNGCSEIGGRRTLALMSIRTMTSSKHAGRSGWDVKADT